MNKLNDGIITCDNCGNDVEWYDYEIMSDEKVFLKLDILGNAPVVINNTIGFQLIIS